MAEGAAISYGVGMSRPIVLFGATGYTGRLTAEALVERGAKPILCGRDSSRVADLADRLGGLPSRTADASDPSSVLAAVQEGGVVISTVGPFVQYGAAAIEAAIAKKATYLDSTGEHVFTKVVNDVWGPQAEGRCALFTAFGFDYVPGQIAGALALQAAGPDGVSVEIGYFPTGEQGADQISSGTKASIARMAASTGFAFSDCTLKKARIAEKVLSFDYEGTDHRAMSVSGTEHLFLPDSFPNLCNVSVGLGMPGVPVRAVSAASFLTAPLLRAKFLDPVVSRLTAGMRNTTGQGPDEAARALTGADVAAIVRAEDGSVLARQLMRGPNAYDMTADLLAWGAIRASEHLFDGTGALGPLSAFGLSECVEGLGSAGMVPVSWSHPFSE